MITDVRFRLGWILGVALLVTSPALAQDQRGDRPDEDPQVRAETRDKPLTLGIQLTPQLLDSLLDKAARRLAKDYGFDEYQHEQMRQVLRERVPKFLMQHQDELQGLLNDWLEAVAADEPPDAEYAAEWAERALPMVEEFRGMVGGMTEEMREFMTDEQEVLLDGYVAVFETGTQFATNRLRVFADGGFDPSYFPRSKRFNELERAEMRQLRQEMEVARTTAMSGSPNAPPRSAPRRDAAKPAPVADTQLAADAAGRNTSPPTAGNAKDEWTRYVEWFIQRYQLNDEQRDKAHNLLKQQQDRRDHYQIGKAAEMERVAKMFEGAKTEKQVELAESAYQKLQEPVGRMFEKLKQKLGKLPTRAQHRAAALADKNQKGPRQRGAAPAVETGGRRPQ